MSAYRNLLKVDADLYKQHLLRLGADSRYARFSGVMSDEAIVRYVDSIDWNWSRIIGYFDKGELRGVAEIRYEMKTFPSQAELAFSVEASYQNSRVGTNLMARSLLILRNRGINTAHVVCLLSNTRMQKLALRYRANMAAHSGEVFLSIAVPYGTVGSILAEMTDGYFGWMNANLEAALKFPRVGAAIATARPKTPSDQVAALRH